MQLQELNIQMNINQLILMQKSESRDEWYVSGTSYKDAYKLF